MGLPRPYSHAEDLPSEMDSNSSGGHFRRQVDVYDESESEADPSSTDLTLPDSPLLPFSSNVLFATQVPASWQTTMHLNGGTDKKLY